MSDQYTVELRGSQWLIIYPNGREERHTSEDVARKRAEILNQRKKESNED